MLESKWTAELCDELRAAGAVVIPIVAGAMAHGWPDRVVWHPLWRGFIEFKGADTAVRAQQRANMMHIDRRRRGTVVAVRYPGLCQTPLGEDLFEFRHGRELLEKLAARESSLNNAGD